MGIKNCILIIFAGLLFNSCCTKKACHVPDPLIKIKAQNFNWDELSGSSIEYRSAADNSLIYVHSTPFVFGNGEYSAYLESYGNTLLRDMYFIVKIADRVDTVYNINYELYLQKYECNTCFLVFPQKETYETYRDFSFYYKGQQHFSEELVISK